MTNTKLVCFMALSVAIALAAQLAAQVQTVVPPVVAGAKEDFIVYAPQPALLRDLPLEQVCLGTVRREGRIRLGDHRGTGAERAGLVVDPAGEPDAVSASLIEECLRSAANKGCASVEAQMPEDPAELKRWKRQGFKDEQPVLRRAVDPAGRRR